MVTPLSSHTIVRGTGTFVEMFKLRWFLYITKCESSLFCWGFCGFFFFWGGGFGHPSSELKEHFHLTKVNPVSYENKKRRCA